MELPDEKFEITVTNMLRAITVKVSSQWDMKNVQIKLIIMAVWVTGQKRDDKEHK